MGSKSLNRRELLKSSAALAGGLTLGAAAPAIGAQQSPESHHAPPPMIKGDKDGMIAYGERSNYVKSVRIPHGGRPSPDTFGLTFHGRGRIAVFPSTGALDRPCGALIRARRVLPL